MNKKQDTPFFQLNGFEKAVVTLGDNTRELSLLELMRLGEMIKSHLIGCSHMMQPLSYYEDYENKIDQILEDEYNNFLTIDQEEENEFVFNVVENFAMYIEGCQSNHDAKQIVKKDYEKEFPNHTLEFDAEHSYCYVYTKDMEEAKRFSLFVYRKYIKPVLDKWSPGFKEFMEEFKNLSPEDQMLFAHI
jgi:hypothetical protein